MPSKSGPPKKSPYRSYSEEDIAATEFGTFVIQVGDDLFSTPNGKMAFNLQRAEMFYEDILGSLHAMKKEGNDIEREDAEKCLLLLRIMPLKIH
jgi:hypothetical protein